MNNFYQEELRVIASNYAPDPIFYKYWVDLNEDPNGSVIKYYENTWIPVSGGGGGGMTPAQIKQYYESNPNTNAYTDVEKQKLASLHNYDDTDIRADITTLSNAVTIIRGDVTTLTSRVNSLTTSVNSKQDILVSGVNIKTINGLSLLGSGNIVISGGGGGGGSVNSVNEVFPDASGNVQLPKIDQLPDDIVDFIQANATRNASNNSITYFRKNLTTGTRTPNYFTLQAATQTEAGLMTAYDKTKLDTGLVQKAGDTMTGSLILNGDPTADLMAVPKQYVEARLAEIETQALTFEGYISTTEPTVDVREGNGWYQPPSAEDTPDTNFPWNIKIYTNGAFPANTIEYTPVSLDMWTNLDVASTPSPSTGTVIYYKEEFLVPDPVVTSYDLHRTPLSVLEVRVLDGDKALYFLRPSGYEVSGMTITISGVTLTTGMIIAVYYNA